VARWALASEANSLVALAGFLDEYPSSRFGGDARIRIRALLPERLQQAYCARTAAAPLCIAPADGKPATLDGCATRM
jgi:hypothetical protein